MAKRNQFNRKSLRHLTSLQLPGNAISGTLQLSGNMSITNEHPTLTLAMSNPGARTMFRIKEGHLTFDASGSGNTDGRLADKSVTDSYQYSSSFIVPRFCRIDALSVRVGTTLQDNAGDSRWISRIGLTSSGSPSHGCAAISAPQWFMSGTDGNLSGGGAPIDMVLSSSGQTAIYHPIQDAAAGGVSPWLHTAAVDTHIYFETDEKTGGTGSITFALHYTQFRPPSSM
jgi:hypothetical protein